MYDIIDLEQLAIDGGKPAKSSPYPPNFPGGMAIDYREEEAVIEVLRSKRLFRYYGPGETQSKVLEFESQFAKRMGTEYSLGVNSCTHALMISLLAAGVQPGDEVIIPAYTFVATAAAVIAANAIPVLAEIDDSFTISPESIEKNISEKTRAIIPVHMRGVSCDMDRIMEIAARYNIKVVEDTAQACGVSYKGKPLGSIGDAGCYSFQFHKIITAGEGGAIVTNNTDFINRAKVLHDTGANWRNDDTMEEGKDYSIFPGYNCRMSEITGAILSVQLQKLNLLLSTMKRHASAIRQAISSIPGVTLRRLNDDNGNAGICVMFTLANREKTQWVAQALKAEGLLAGTMGSKEVPNWHIYSHWKHLLAKRGNNDSGFPFSLTTREYNEDMCPETTDLLLRVIHMEISPLLTDSDVEEIITGLNKVLYRL